MTIQDKEQTRRTFLQKAAGIIAVITFIADLISVGQLVLAILLASILAALPASIAPFITRILAPIFAKLGVTSVIETIGLATSQWNIFNLGGRVLLIVLIFGLAISLYLYFKQNQAGWDRIIYAVSWLYMLLAMVMIISASIRFTHSTPYTLSQFIGYTGVSIVIIMLVYWSDGLVGPIDWRKWFAFLWMLLLLFHILRLIFAGAVALSWMFAGNIVLLLLIYYQIILLTGSSIEKPGVQG